MGARDYLLLGDASLAAAQQKLAVVLQEWAAAWGLAPDTVRCSVERAWTVNHRVRSELDEEFAMALSARLFPATGRASQPAGASIARGAAQAAQESLQRRLQPLVGLAEQVEPAWRQPGSGAVRVSLCCGNAWLFYWLPAALLYQLIGKKPAPAALPPLPALDMLELLRGVPVCLPVHVGQVGVDLAHVLALRVGDVVRITRAVEAPLAIGGAPDAPLFHGYLGRSGGQFAIDVALGDGTGVNHE